MSVKTIILLGAPGAGKGTIAEGIRSASAFLHVSTGDMLREAVKRGTPVGRQAEAYMKRGELVPDAVILGIVEERLDRGGTDDAYMFDGFPRTMEQARLLDDALARRNAAVDKVFLLDAPRDLLIARLTGRRVCRKCGQGYHVVNIPPKQAGVCDVCGGELYQRADDSEATILNRLEVYTKQTESLIAFYEGKGVLVRVDSSRARQETVAEILRDESTGRDMIIIKTRDEIRQMRESCRLAARVRDELARQVTPGVTTRWLDEQAAGLIKAMGGVSAFLGYRGYPGNICLSIDDEVVHGIPSERRIEFGQIVSIDVGVVYGGFVGDTATTVMVGVTDPEVVRLVRTTEQALAQGIAKARVGQRLSDISNAIEAAASRGGFSVVRDFVGHGIGRKMHEDPQIPNYGEPGRGPKLKAGMTFAIEPMVNMGGYAVEVMPDGWTVLTLDRKPSAHFEHTVVIGEDGPEILTVAA